MEETHDNATEGPSPSTAALTLEQTADEIGGAHLAAQPQPEAPSDLRSHLESPADGIEIIRLPWGYAVTRTTSTP